MPVFGDGAQTRSFSHIRSVAQCIAESVSNPDARNETFNVGGDEPMSVLELARLVAESAGTPANVEHLPARAEVQHAHATHDKARRVFGEAYDRIVPIAAGLRETVQYVRSHPIPAPTECPAEIEIVDKLPPAWQRRISGRS